MKKYLPFSPIIYKSCLEINLKGNIIFGAPLWQISLTPCLAIILNSTPHPKVSWVY